MTETCRGCGGALPQKRGPKRIWCSGRCRKLTLYASECIDCGAPCNTDGRVTDVRERCHACASKAKIVWTPETITAAIQRWADEHDGVPPTSSQWQSKENIEHGKFPATDTVYRVVGPWHRALNAAGFDPPKVGRPPCDPAVLAETVRLYRTGMTLAEVGEVMGVHWGTVRLRLVRAGEPRRARFTGLPEDF